MKTLDNPILVPFGNRPKVLISAPIDDNKLYCWDEFIKGLKKTRNPFTDILLVDTSKDKNMQERILKEGFMTAHAWEEKPMDRVVKARQMAVNFMKAKCYDYILMIDADAILDENTVSILSGHNKLVVSAVLNKIGDNMLPCPVPKISPGEQMPLDWMGTGLRDVFEIGFGAALISTKVFHLVPKIACVRDDKGKLLVGEDFVFSSQCRDLGIPLCVDTDYQIPHKIQGQWNWDEA